jgi:hypothetical protein
MIFNNIWWYKMVLLFNFIAARFCFQSFETFGQNLVSFRLFQILEISDLALTKDKKVNIAVT